MVLARSLLHLLGRQLHDVDAAAGRVLASVEPLGPLRQDVLYALVGVAVRVEVVVGRRPRELDRRLLLGQCHPLGVDAVGVDDMLGCASQGDVAMLVAGGQPRSHALGLRVGLHQLVQTSQEVLALGRAEELLVLIADLVDVLGRLDPQRAPQRPTGLAVEAGAG
jgi:hypothetical protein